MPLQYTKRDQKPNPNTMKTLTLALILTIFSVGLFSQDFNVPENYRLEAKEDFALYEQDVIKCVDWLLNTPIRDQSEKRKEANIFLLEWLTGSPYVRVELKKGIVTFSRTTPSLTLIFMGGWAKQALETRDFENKVASNLAGIESVIEFYTKNRKTLSRDRNVEKYIKMKEKGTLLDFIEQNVPESIVNKITDSSPRYQSYKTQ